MGLGLVNAAGTATVDEVCSTGRLVKDDGSLSGDVVCGGAVTVVAWCPMWSVTCGFLTRALRDLDLGSREDVFSAQQSCQKTNI